MQDPKLFMILLGATPNGRNIEQHDIFFGIGSNLSDLIPEMKAFWPEAGEKIHIDGYRSVTKVDGYRIEVVPREEEEMEQSASLFFLNLGGYKRGEFEEFHYKVLTVGKDKSIAIKWAKEHIFYKHTGFEGAPSHIDDRYGVDVDDVFEIKDILNERTKRQYRLKISKAELQPDDELWLGYLPLTKLT